MQDENTFYLNRFHNESEANEELYEQIQPALNELVEDELFSIGSPTMQHVLSQLEDEWANFVQSFPAKSAINYDSASQTRIISVAADKLVLAVENKLRDHFIHKAQDICNTP